MTQTLVTSKQNSITFCLIGLFLLTVEAHDVSLSSNGCSVNELKLLESGNNGVILAKKKFTCPIPFGTFPDPEDCSYFYICMFGRSRHQKCSPGARFDTFRRVCLPALIAICDKGNENKQTTSAEKTTTTVKDSKFRCPSLYGSFPHPTDCSKYYTCSFFISSLKSCSEGQLFDAVKKTCNPEGEVDCGSRQRPTSEITAVTTPMTQEPTFEITTAAEQSTTEEFITTKDPVVTELPTTTETTTLSTTAPKPTGPPETDCDEEDLDCIITETGEIPDWFECPVDIGAFPHPSHKKLFIFCQNWKPFVKKCGQDLVFSREDGTCVPPDN